MKSSDYTYPKYAKIIHLGLALFGVIAFFTGELAEEGVNSTGYLLHAYVGLSMAAFVVTRIAVGFSRSESMSLRGWSPFSRPQLMMALEDLRSVLSLKIPERGRHQGLAGITQAAGLIIFTWMAVTGSWLYLIDDDAGSELFEFVEEAHELAGDFIPVYLALHVGAVLLHSVKGHPVWQRMFSTK